MENTIPPEVYAKRHKAAFRVAFDYLNAHFPPVDDPEWWDQAAKDASAASASQDENRLAMELISGVMDYLEYELKLRRNKNGTEDRQD